MEDGAGPSDDDIRRMARERAAFKQHLMMYVLVNILLILVWFFTTAGDLSWGSFWPIWPMLGWGIGVAMHGFGVYGGGPSLVQKEEEKLRRKFG